MVEYKYLFAVLLAAAIISIVGVSLTQAQQGLTTEAGEGVTADLPFIKNIDFYKFQGIWYEIASKPNIIEKKCLCGQSLDQRVSTTSFNLHESCMILGKNVTSKSSIVADAPGLGNFTNWNGPLSAPYWVIDIDYLYRWVVIGQPSRKGYWIQSRTKTLDQELVDSLNKKWQSQGFDLSNLEYMDQSCSN